MVTTGLCIKIGRPPSSSPWKKASRHKLIGWRSSMVFLLNYTPNQSTRGPAGALVQGEEEFFLTRNEVK